MTRGGLQVRDGVAVDFGGTKISAARVEDGKVVGHVQTTTDSEADASAQIDVMAGLLQHLEITSADRLGVAVTGRVDRDGNWYAINIGTLSRIDTVPLRQMLEERFQRAVCVMNDATAAAVGEYVAGAGRGSASLGYLTVSTGVGGGFVLDGVPLRSAGGLAGHAGFTTSLVAVDRCGSGRDRTVESIAGGRAIAQRASEAGHPGLDARAVYESYLGGASWARPLIEQSAEAVAGLCGNLKSLLDPDLILLGGSIGLAPGYLELVRSYVEREPPLFRPTLAASTLGAHAALIGVLAV